VPKTTSSQGARFAKLWRVSGDPAEGHQRGERLERKAEHERRDVHAQLREHAVDRVLPVGGEPVEMVRAVVDGVDPPERLVGVARPVVPVHGQVSEDDHGDAARPERRRGDERPQLARDVGSRALLDEREDEDGERAPREVLSEEEEAVGDELGPHDRLPAPRRKRSFERRRARCNLPSWGRTRMLPASRMVRGRDP
jgi:hypothetical protein